MNKKLIGIFVALLLCIVGYAAVATNLFVNSSVAIGFDEADFNIFFSKVLDGETILNTISEDGDSFTYQSTGENMITYSIINRSMKYDAVVNVTCDQESLITQDDEVLLGGSIKTGTISSSYVGEITCELCSNAVARTENSEAPYNVHTLTMNPNEGSIDITEFYFVESEPIGKLPTPIKEGYTFVGWFNQPEGTTEGLEEITEDKVYSNSEDITIYAHYEQAGVNLFNLIKDQAKSDTIDFSVHSGTSGTNGVYKTTATEGNVPVYYFRGSHEGVNNNLIFNNMCWKIIRTTETGGVKIIYNGTPTNGQCTNTTGTSTQIGTSAFNTNYNDNAYVGYMYGTTGSTTYAATHANINDSTIKTYIDDWYSNNFTGSSVTSKLEDTVFCNDRSTVSGGNNNSLSTSYGTLGYGQNYTGYGALARSSYYTLTPKPSLACPQANDKFTVSSTNGNGKLTYPVGLITLDEAILAGFNTYKSNTSDYKNTTNYLYTNQYYWTFSPVFALTNAIVGNVYSTGNVDRNDVGGASGVRPVVSLADGTLVGSDGEGSSTKPYVVS